MTEQSPASLLGADAPEAATILFFPPGCEHPGCHNSRAMDYADGYATNWPGAQRAKFIYWPSLRAKLGRRWCRSHALLNEGVAFG